MPNCLKLLTNVPVKDIDAIDLMSAADVNKAKELLAYELTSLVHSREAAEKAIATAKSLFGGGADAEHMPPARARRAAWCSRAAFRWTAKR